MDEKIIRETIKDLLNGGNAHMKVEEAVKDFPMEKINLIFPNGTYTSWHLLEHIRRTQQDILDFMINPNYKELDWPKDYWPNPKDKATDSIWNRTLKQFSSDLKQLEQMVMDKNLDLTKKIPHGQGQTYMREFLLVADHNAYHIGEFAIMRQVMNTWKK